LFSQAEHAARLRGVDAAEKDLAGFRTRARRQHHAGDRQQFADLEIGLLDALAADHLLGRLVLLDDAGHHLPDPGMVTSGIGAGAELADQDHLVAPGVVHQHAARLAAFEHLAADLAAHAALVQRVTEDVADDFEVALEHNLLADNLRRLLAHHATPS